MAKKSVGCCLLTKALMRCSAIWHLSNNLIFCSALVDSGRLCLALVGSGWLCWLLAGSGFQLAGSSWLWLNLADSGWSCWLGWLAGSGQLCAENVPKTELNRVPKVVQNRPQNSPHYGGTKMLEWASSGRQKTSKTLCFLVAVGRHPGGIGN